MRRFETIHGVVALILAGFSCGPQVVRHVATVPRVQIQKTVDECVAKEGKKACEALCFEVFQRHDLKACGIEEGKETADVWHEDNQSKDDNSGQGCAGGRRPAGLQCAPHRPTIAGYFAWSAQMEAASVTAFARVYRELVALGADSALLARVHTACGDEIA